MPILTRYYVGWLFNKKPIKNQPESWFFIGLLELIYSELAWCVDKA